MPESKRLFSTDVFPYFLLNNPSLGTYQEIPPFRPISIALPENDDCDDDVGHKGSQTLKMDYMSDAPPRF